VRDLDRDGDRAWLAELQQPGAQVSEAVATVLERPSLDLLPGGMATAS
jgi:hypothetical protein